MTKHPLWISYIEKERVLLMYYIAFDQASNDTGFSVFESNGDTLIEYGKYITKSHDFFDKVIETEDFITGIIDKYLDKGKEVQVGLEDIQLQQFRGRATNVQTFKRLAQLQGSIVVNLKRNYPDIEMRKIYASSWKSTSEVKGKNRTEQKQNAQRIVKKMFDLDRVTQDEADAILIGRHLASQEMNWG